MSRFDSIFNSFSAPIPPSDSQQTKIRIIFVGSVLVLSAYSAEDVDLTVLISNPMVAISTTYFVMSLLMHFWIGAVLRRSEPIVTSLRRIRFVCLVCDLTALSLYTAVAGSLALYLLPFYVTCAIGYGFRFGLSYFLLALFSGLIGFSVAKTVNPYLQANPEVINLYYVSMLFIPLYALVLIKRYWESVADLEESTGTLNRLVGTISHEFRAPLQSLVSLSEMALSEARANAAENRAIIDKLTALRVVGHQLISVSTLIARESIAPRNAANKARSKRHITNLYQLTRKVVDVCRARALSNNQQIDWKIIRNVPIFLQLDPVFIGGVMTNLIDNAVKYGGNGPIKIVISPSKQGTDDYVGISIIDSGPGMRAQNLSESKSEDSTDSVGLGLQIVETQVRALGGKIEFRNLDPAGLECFLLLPSSLDHVEIPQAPRTQVVAATTELTLIEERATRRAFGKDIFFLYIDKLNFSSIAPILVNVDCVISNDVEFLGRLKTYMVESLTLAAPPLLVRQTNLPDNDTVSSDCANVNLDLRNPQDFSALQYLCDGGIHADVKGGAKYLGVTCLLVEDSETIQELLKHSLHRMGIEPDIAINPNEALEKLSHGQYNVVITDLTFSGYDELDFLSKFREVMGSSKKLFVLSGRDDETARATARSCRVDQYLVKPVSHTALRNALNRELKGHLRSVGEQEDFSHVKEKNLPTNRQPDSYSLDEQSLLLDASLEVEYLCAQITKAKTSGDEIAISKIEHRLDGIFQSLGVNSPPANLSVSLSRTDPSDHYVQVLEYLIQAQSSLASMTSITSGRSLGSVTPSTEASH